MLGLDSLLRHCAVALLSPGALAGIVYVDASLTTGLDDGSSWADAYQGSDGLRRALLVAAAGDQVFVAQGTYLPTTTGARDLPFVPADGVELYGGFLGTESSPAERPPLGSAPTVLSGDLNGDDPLTADNSYSVVEIGGLGRASLLDGLLIRGANNDTGPLCGGGLACAKGVSCDLTVRNCILRENHARNGGAFCVIDIPQRPAFRDCVFEDNVADVRDGGAGVIYTNLPLGQGVVIDRCVFRNNQAPRGGALSFTGGVFVMNSLFESNSAEEGGALFMSSFGGFRFDNNTVVASVTSTSDSGAIHLDVATPVPAVNCILWDNEGPGGSQTAADQISGTGATFSIVEGGLPGEGNLASDPQFVDASGGDYSLLPSSPAVDAGSNDALPASIQLDLAQNPRYADEITVPDTGFGGAPVIDIGALERVPTPVPTFCDASDGSLAACPCANPGSPGTGCDLAQGTGGVHVDVVAHYTTPSNRTTMVGSGFPASSFPASVVVRAPSLDPQRPVAFGDGLRCVGTPLVRLAAATASVGIVEHAFGHGAMAGPGDFHYQLWFRNKPAAYCTPDAFNLSDGVSLVW